jgi:hypothetical protein
MAMRTIAIHISLMLAALAATDPALAQAKSDRWPLYPGFGRIRCAAASDLCAWKRIPGASIWPRGYRAPRQPPDPFEPSPQ